MELYSNMTEAKTLNAIALSGRKPSRCLDLGSWDGGDAIAMQKAFPGAEVIAVEGSPLRIWIVRENCEPLGIAVIEAVVTGEGGKELVMEHSAIGDEPHCGTLKGFKNDAPFPNGWHKIGSIKVTSTGILDILKRTGKVDLLHMDIEGMEYEILEKVLPLEDSPAVLSMEVSGALWFNGCKKREDLIGLVSKYGYSTLYDGITDMVFAK